MINLRQLQRLLDSGEAGTGGMGGAGAAFERVIERILNNGRCHCPAVRRALFGSTAVRAVATGLALQRCCELTYGPTAMGRDLADRLATMMDDEGLFGGDIAATAVAVRALLDWVDASGEGVSDVAQRAIAGLGECQDASGLLGGDVVASAIVLWQLGDRPTVCEAFGEVHWHALIAAVRRCGGAVGEEFSRFAYAMAA